MEDRAALDLHLARSALAGDADAFGNLVAAYQQRVAGIAWRYGVRRDEIEDVVSEVFIKVHQNLHRFRPTHPFSAWLHRLAVNHVIDHGRTTRRHRETNELPARLADRAPNAGQRAESRERAGIVRQAIEALPDRYREAIFLVYVEGMKVDEAARVLGLPQGTIKTRLMRGRKGLRRILTRKYPEYFGERDEVS